MRAEKEAAEKQIVLLAAQMKKEADTMISLRKRISDLEGQIKSITEENELAENQISLLQTQGKKDKDAIATLTAQGQRDSDEIAELKRRVAELESLLKQANGRTLSRALSYTPSHTLTSIYGFLLCIPVIQTNMAP